jgi:hypothetical protein
MHAVVIAHFGLEMGLIVIITIHVGAIRVQKILYALRMKPKLIYFNVTVSNQEFKLTKVTRKDHAFVLLGIKVMRQPMNVSTLMNAH